MTLLRRLVSVEELSCPDRAWSSLTHFGVYHYISVCSWKLDVQCTLTLPQRKKTDFREQVCERVRDERVCQSASQACRRMQPHCCIAVFIGIKRKCLYKLYWQNTWYNYCRYAGRNDPVVVWGFLSGASMQVVGLDEPLRSFPSWVCGCPHVYEQVQSRHMVG